jgi:hypothetical protein
MTTTTNLADTDELTAMKHLAAGRSIGFAAAAAGLTEAQTRRIADRHGPDRHQLVQAVDHLLAEHETRHHEEIPAAETLRPHGKTVVQRGPHAAEWTNH